jgi:hypothetical protein
MWEGGELLLGSTLEHLRHLELAGHWGVGKCQVFIGRWAILVGFIWDLYGIYMDLCAFIWIYLDF